MKRLMTAAIALTLATKPLALSARADNLPMYLEQSYWCEGAYELSTATGTAKMVYVIGTKEVLTRCYEQGIRDASVLNIGGVPAFFTSAPMKFSRLQSLGIPKTMIDGTADYIGIPVENLDCSIDVIQSDRVE